MIKTSLVVVINGSFRGVDWRDFMLMAECAQTAYDTVADYVARGLVLQEVRIQQQGKWILWPIAMFTNQSLEQKTQPMQQEWETILSPLPVSVQLRWQRKAFLRRQIRFYEQQIERTHQRITPLAEASRKPIRFHDASLRDGWERQIEERLNSQQNLLAHLQGFCQNTVDYLKVLELEELEVGNAPYPTDRR